MKSCASETRAKLAGTSRERGHLVRRACEARSRTWRTHEFRAFALRRTGCPRSQHELVDMTSLERYVGQVLDEKYRLERLLGQGGMGAVYLATHLGTGRYVALKLIMPQFMRNEEFVERFKREARAAGRLRHPNVVDVTDFGFSGSGTERVAYLVMEYLDGCTLSDVLFEENRLPLYWVVDILEQVCSAVHEAHQQGIVHRDLKPDNIWLEPNGLGGYRIKVLDFGVAKLGGEGGL